MKWEEVCQQLTNEKSVRKNKRFHWTRACVFLCQSIVAELVGNQTIDLLKRDLKLLISTIIINCVMFEDEQQVREIGWVIFL